MPTRIARRNSRGGISRRRECARRRAHRHPSRDSRALGARLRNTARARRRASDRRAVRSAHGRGGSSRRRSGAPSDRPSARGCSREAVSWSRAGGAKDGERIAPLLARLSIPESWRCVVALPASTPGMSGDAEAAGLSRSFLRRRCAKSSTSPTCVLMSLLPALVEGDLDAFGRALTEIQQINGAGSRRRRAGHSPGPSTELIEQHGASGARRRGTELVGSRRLRHRRRATMRRPSSSHARIALNEAARCTSISSRAPAPAYRARRPPVVPSRGEQFSKDTMTDFRTTMRAPERWIAVLRMVVGVWFPRASSRRSASSSRRDFFPCRRRRRAGRP